MEGPQPQCMDYSIWVWLTLNKDHEDLWLVTNLIMAMALVQLVSVGQLVPRLSGATSPTLPKTILWGWATTTCMAVLSILSTGRSYVTIWLKIAHVAMEMAHLCTLLPVLGAHSLARVLAPGPCVLLLVFTLTISCDHMLQSMYLLGIVMDNLHVAVLEVLHRRKHSVPPTVRLAFRWHCAYLWLFLVANNLLPIQWPLAFAATRGLGMVMNLRASVLVQNYLRESLPGAEGLPSGLPKALLVGALAPQLVPGWPLHLLGLTVGPLVVMVVGVLIAACCWDLSVALTPVLHVWLTAIPSPACPAVSTRTGSTPTVRSSAGQPPPP